MTADPVRDWARYWYEKLQIEAWLRPIRPRAPRPSFTVPKVCLGGGSDTDLDKLSARRKQKDRREAVFLFVLEDQAQHGEKVGDHVAVHESVAGPKRRLAASQPYVRSRGCVTKTWKRHAV
jgi:hypothetical protein